MFASTTTAVNVQNYEIQWYQTNTRLRMITCELHKLSFSVIMTDIRWQWNAHFLLHENRGLWQTAWVQKILMTFNVVFGPETDNCSYSVNGGWRFRRVGTLHFVSPKRTNACTCIAVHYTQCIPPTCFGHSHGHLQWGVLLRKHRNITKFLNQFTDKKNIKF